MSMKSHHGLVYVALIIVAAGAMILRGNLHVLHAVTNKTQLHASSPPSTSRPTSTASTQDPLTIDAIRSRKYNASAIATAQNIGEKGGYHDSVISFTSDGLKEFALEATPNTVKPVDGYPIIILIHGYIQPSDYVTTDASYEDFIAAWARAGFVVIKPDLRGNGTSQGTAVSGHYSPDYSYDVLNLIASLKKYSLVNSSDLGIFGHSMGGHIALDVAVVDPSIKATIIANGVVGSMYDIFYNWPNSPAPSDAPQAVVQSELQQLELLHGTPKTNPSFYDEVSAINYVNAISGPVQLNQDISDTTVPKLFSDNLDHALLQAHKSVTYYLYPGNDHQLEAPATRAEILQRSTSFYLKYL